MKFSQIWWMIVALLFAFATTESVLTAQTEEPSAVNAPSSAEVQSDSVEAQSSSNEPEQKQPVLGPNRDTVVKVETEILNELRRELLDDRAKTLDWWLAITAIFLTFLAIIIPIAAFIGGHFSFKKFNEIKDEAQRHVEEIKARRDEADSLVKGVSAMVAGADSDKTNEVVKSVQQNPGSSLIERAVAAALALQQQNRIEEAIEKWNSIANVVEGTDNELAARAWFSVGYLVSPENGDGDACERALEAYDKAIQLNPNLAVAYNNRGVTKGALGQHEAAITDYDAAIARNYAAAYNNRGTAKAELGQHEAAIADFDATIARNPDDAEAYYNRGKAKAELGQHEAAIADYDAAIARNPDDAEAYYNRGIAKGNLGQHEAAIVDYDAAIARNPDDAAAYYNRGNEKGGLGQHEAAIADFDEAITRNPDGPAAYNNRGISKAELGQHEAAIADFDEAITRNPDDFKAYNNRGVSKSELGQYEAAIADFDEAITRNPDFADAYNDRGAAKIRLHRIDEAQQDFETALNLAQAVDNAELAAQAAQALRNLNRGDAP